MLDDLGSWTGLFGMGLVFFIYNTFGLNGAISGFVDGFLHVGAGWILNFVVSLFTAPLFLGISIVVYKVLVAIRDKVTNR
jgi:hypothetical protein